MFSYELKIKAKALAAEAKIIKSEEAKLKRFERRLKAAKAANNYREQHREERMSLQGHRRGVLRTEARSTHLARAFLSGRPYVALERSRYLGPDWAKTWAMILKYGPASSSNEQKSLQADFEAWKQVGEDAVIRLPIKAKVN